MAKYYIGIDLGGTFIKGGIVNENGEILVSDKTPTEVEKGDKGVAANIAKLANMLLERQGLTVNDVEGLGIGSPGMIDSNEGNVVYANNLGWENFRICDELSRLLGGIKVKIGNDANVAALGEVKFGAARNYNSAVMITLGTGVGGGIVIDGKLFGGFNGIAGELGHIVIEYDGKPCSCGRRGCWEAYSSATGLINMTKEKLAECESTGRKTIMTELVRQKGKVSGVTAFDAMRLGDEAGREVVDTYVGYLACGLTNMVNIFRPEVISLGGGVSNEGQSLVDALLPLIRKEQYGGAISYPTDIRIAKLGNDAGIIGAALLSV